jgi:hypothetical protein
MQGDLAAPSAMTALTDSAVVLAVVSAFLSPEAAWRAAQPRRTTVIADGLDHAPRRSAMAGIFNPLAAAPEVLRRAPGAPEPLNSEMGFPATRYVRLIFTLVWTGPRRLP